MPKLKPLSVGLSLGIMLAVLYTLRTIVLMLFPDFVVNVGNKMIYQMIIINIPVITIDSYIIGIIALFLGGLVLGAVFSSVYHKVAK